MREGRRGKSILLAMVLLEAFEGPARYSTKSSKKKGGKKILFETGAG